MNDALFYTLLLAGAELIEAFIQRAPTLYGILQNLYLYYRKHIFLFFLVQPGFYTLFIIMKTGVLNAPMIFLVALKIFDIFYKMELIRQLFVRQEISAEFAQMLEWPIPSWFFMLGVGLYPPMLYYALS